MEKITITDIKKTNRSEIYQLIYHEGKLSKQDIANRLHMSLPTVSQNLKELEELQLIEKNGQFASQIGRKAMAYSLISNSKIAIGVEILKRKILILALDLYGQVIQHLEFNICYENTHDYYQEVGKKILAFIDSLAFSGEQILGIGFAVQGLISYDKTEVVYGKVLNCTGVNISVFSDILPYPCYFIHDAECAAIAELWLNPNLTDAFYLSIGKHLGGSLIINGQIHKGKNARSGTIEHITVNPEGNICYCGKRGCLETYCSIHSLLEKEESLDDFFKKLRNNDENSVNKWEYFLDYLSTAINNLHRVVDCDIILGGHIAPYLTDGDIHKLHAAVQEKTAFPESSEFIYLSICTQNAVPIGSALPYIKEYLASI